MAHLCGITAWKWLASCRWFFLIARPVVMSGGNLQRHDTGASRSLRAQTFLFFRAQEMVVVYNCNRGIVSWPWKNLKKFPASLICTGCHAWLIIRVLAQVLPEGGNTFVVNLWGWFFFPEVKLPNSCLLVQQGILRLLKASKKAKNCWVQWVLVSRAHPQINNLFLRKISQRGFGDSRIDRECSI